VTAAGVELDPCELEQHYQSPLFREICVTSLPDAEGNDLPVLAVVPAGPHVTAQALADELALLRARAPAHLRLTRLAVLAGPLPRTATGKVRRLQVRALVGRRPAHEGPG